MAQGDSNVNENPRSAHRVDQEGVRSAPLSFEELKASALARFGFPLRDVEVTDSQLRVFLQTALDEYNTYSPVEKYDTLENATAAVNAYDLKVLRKPFGRGVVAVEIGTKENFFSPISAWSALGVPFPITHINPDEYALALNYIKTSRSVYSSQSDWKWEEPVLWLYAPSGFGGPFVVSYTYLQDHASPEEIPTYDRAWFKKFFAALVKEAVGEVRGKFGSTPGPNQASLRGADMISEAQTEQQALLKILRDKSFARTPPLWLGPGR